MKTFLQKSRTLQLIPNFRPKFIFWTFLLLFFSTTLYAANITSTAAGGNWSATTTWVGGVVPIASDNITIAGTATVTMNVNFTVSATLTVNGDIVFSKNDNKTLTVNGTIIFGANGNVTSATGGNTANAFNLSSGATLITANIFGISGTNCSLPANDPDFVITLTSGANYEFNGTANQNTLGLPLTGINNLTINNSGSTGNNTVSLTSGSTTINSNLAVTSGTFDLLTNTANRSTPGGTITIANGAALKIGGTGTFPSNYTAHTLGATSTIEYSGTNQTVTNENYGHLTLSGSGTKTMPGTALTVRGNFTTSGSASATAASAISIGGNVTIGSGSTFNGGSFTHNVAGNWSNSGTFNANTSTINFNGTTAQTTGGASNTNFNVLKVNNSAGLSLGKPGTVSTLTIGDVTANSIFSDGGNQVTSTGTLNLTSGTFNLGSGATGTSFPAFTTNNIGATTTVNYNASGAQTIAAVNYGNLTNTGNGPRTLASAGTIGVKGVFSPGGGAYTIIGSTISFNGTTAQTIPAFNYNNLTVTNTNTNITLQNGGTIGIAGIFTPGNTSFGTITGSTVSFNGTSAQTIPQFTFNNLTINNAAGISSIGGNITVNSNLSLANGVVTTGANKMISPNGGSVTRTSGWINGNLQQYIGSTSAVSFPVGSATVYRPVTVNFTSLTTPGNLTVSSLAGAHPQFGSSGLDAAKSLTPYWNLSSGGVAGTYNAVFNFAAGDVPGGASTSNFVVRNYNGSWTVPTTGTRTGTSTQATGVSTFGDYVIGEIIGVIVSTQPANAIACEGGNASFTSTSASVPVPSVQWQRNTGSGWVNITSLLDGGVYSNFTTTTLNVTGAPVSLNGYLFRAVFTNLNGSANSNSATLTVNPGPSATISYPGSPFGSTVSLPQPVTLSGTPGGSFSAPGGLSINAGTGAVTPNTSTPGTYTVTYTIPASGGCGIFTTTTTVTITQAPTANISYSASPFCVTVGGPQTVTISGSGAYTGGTFTSTAGLTIDPTTGAITPNTSTPGSYVVTYNIPPSAPYPASTTTTSVTITAVPTASISYAGGPFCTSDQVAKSVTLTGTGAYLGGVYASDAGLVLNTANGDFTPNGSTAGGHTVTYTVPAGGGCATVPVTTTINIASAPSASITYGGPYCKAETAPQGPVLTGTSGGTYSAAAGLAINSSTGAVTPSASTAGVYTVLYTIPASGSCGIVQISATVEILDNPTGAIAYTGGPFCASGSPVAVNFSGTSGNWAGGNFAAAPAGLNINSTNGTITLNGSTPNDYNITYTTPNCPVTFTTPVQITVAPVASISYAASAFCQNDGSVKAVTLVGDPGGNYSAPAGLSINTVNGDITPSTSTAGTYTVSYIIPASGTCAPVTATTQVTITAPPTVTINYAGTPFCSSSATPQAVTLSGTGAYTGGTFSSTSGLAINASSGAVTPGSSLAGSYTISYTTLASGGCVAVPATTSVTITQAPAANISYATPFCISAASSYAVNYTTTAGNYIGGTFSSSPAGLTLDASGTVYPGSSLANTYNITYTIPPSAGCGAVPTSTSLTIHPLPTSNAGPDMMACSNAIGVNITGGSAATNYTSVYWSSDGTGTFNNANSLTTATYTPSAQDALAGVVTLTLTVNGLTPCASVSATKLLTFITAPDVMASPATQTVCSGSSISTVSLGSSVGGASFSWNRDNPAGVTGSGGLSVFSGTGNINGTFTSSTGVPATITFSATATAGGCTGNAAIVATVQVDPVGTANAVSNQTVCNNTATVPVTFSGNTGNFTWTNSNTAIGLAASGTGNIPSFTATNPGTAPISATITVTPLYNGCPGTPTTFTFTVNPTPVFTGLAAPAVCSGSALNYTPNSSATGVTLSYNWSRAVVAGISNGAASGTGNISETLTNTTILAVPVTYVYTVTATNNGVSCTSATTSNLIVSINPRPTVSATPSSSQTICSGSNMTAINLANPNGVSGTTLSWTRTNTTNITGLASSGNPSSTVPASALTNNTTTSQVTVITAQAAVSATGCQSTTNISITVLAPIVNTVGDGDIAEVQICGLVKQVTVGSSPATGATGVFTYQWQVSSPGSNNWSDIPGATGSTLVYNISNNAFFRRIAYSGTCSNTSLEAHANGPISNPPTATASNGGSYCAGGSGVTISLSAGYAGAVYTLQWYNGSTWVNQTTPAPVTSDGTAVIFNNVTTAGTYQISATIPGPGGCTAIAAGNPIVTINPLPTAPTVNAPAAVCQGSATNIIGTTGAGITVNWYAAATGGSPLNGTPLVSGTGYSVNPTTTTTYYAGAVNSTTGCVSSSRTPVTVTVNQKATMTSAAVQTICSGGSVNIPLTNSVNAGATYTWIAVDNASTTGESTTTKTAGTINDAITNLTGVSQTVTYTVTPTYPAGCTGNPQTVTITVDPKPVIINQVATICTGTSFSITPANGGGNTVTTNPATTYTWTPTAGVGNLGSGTTISDNPVNSTAGAITATYSVVPSAGVCTGTAFTTTVTVNPRPVISNTTVASCSGTPFTVSPSTGGGNTVPAGTLYNWAPPSGINISGIAPGANQPNVNGTLSNTSSPGVPVTATYTVNPVGPAGLGSCTGTPFTVVATINPTPTASISGTVAVCQNSSASILFTGNNGTTPYTFTYNINGVGSNTVSTVSGNSISMPVSTAATGTFTYGLLSVSDGSTGCSQAQGGSAVITVKQQPVIQDYTVAVCNATNFTITPATGVPTGATVVPAGTVYNWSAPALPAGVTGATNGTNASSISQTLTNSNLSVQNITYAVTPSVTGCAGLPFNISVAIDPALAANTAIWKGTTSSDWCNTANWACGIIPDAFKDAIIPSGAMYMPALNCNADVNNITVQPGATLSIPTSRTLNVFGTITNTDATRYTLSGTVNFTGGFGGIGNTSQVIPAFVYNGLTVTGNATTKTLAGNVTVNGWLTLNGGIVISSPSNMLTIGTSGSVTAGSNQSYIQGPLTRLTSSSTTTYNFPVGAGGLVRTAYIIPASNTPSSYTVNYNPSSPTINNVLDANLAGIQKNEYWNIVRNYGSNARVGFDYQNPNMLAAGAATTDWNLGVNPCGGCNVAVVTGNALNNWYYSGGVGTTGFAVDESTYWQSNNTVFSKTMTTFGQFTFGYGYAVILPLKLVSFTGNIQGRNGLLEWEYAAVDDLAASELQYSRDGAHFSKLALINATPAESYQYIDKNLEAGTHYYRLLIKDKWGKNTFSQTILLVAGKDITVIQGLRPNIVKSDTWLDVHSATSQNIGISLLDLSGRIVGQYRLNLLQGDNKLRLNTGMLIQGMYILQVKTADGVQAQLRFIKE